uniref:Fibronectin type-III domain-containing protein n=1 Tax=Anopheles culicifacies TaxID=139723 RepID=A0A182MGS8_9DIPT
MFSGAFDTGPMIRFTSPVFPTRLNHEIHNLETYTQYLVSIQVFNPEGLGPPTTVLVMTDEGGKCKPQWKLLLCVRVFFFVILLLLVRCKCWFHPITSYRSGTNLMEAITSATQNGFGYLIHFETLHVCTKCLLKYKKDTTRSFS